MSMVDVERAAVTRFAARGFSAVGIRELGREVGLNSASLYHYAPSKEHLLVGIMRSCLTELLRAAERVAADSADPSILLAGLVGTNVAMSATNPLTCRVTDQEVRSLTGVNLAEILKLRDRYELMWQRALTAGARDGSFQIVDVQLTRLVLLDMCNGVANWYDAGGRRSIAQLQRQYVQLSHRAVGAPVPAAFTPVKVNRLQCEPPAIRRSLRKATA